MNDKKCNGRVTVMALSTAKVSRRRERALMRFEGKLAGMERSKLQKLGRVSSVNITSIRVWRCGTSTGGEDRGSKDDVAYYSVEHLSLRSPLHVGLVPSREKVYENEHALSPCRRRRPNCTTSAYYPPLNYSPLTAKIAPRHPLPPRKAPTVFYIATFSRLTRRAAHCFNRITSILNCH